MVTDAKPQDSDGVTSKNVEEWKRYFDEHVEQFVAAHEAIIRKAQSDAEPVAWACRADTLRGLWWDKPIGVEEKGYSIEPLYAAPPRPDASAELAELQERSLENNRLAFQWMERHDKIVGFISKNYPSVMLPNLPFPSPVSRPDTSAGISWSGFNIYGDRESIDAVLDMMHAKNRCETLDKMIAAKQLVRYDAAGLIEAEGECPVCASWVKLRAHAADRSAK